MISIANLQKGIQWWLARKDWPKDLHNADYHEFYQDRGNALTPKWLKATVDRLAVWKAVRSPKKPNTKEHMLALAMSQLASIQAEFERIMQKVGCEPAIDSVTWEDISYLYDVIAGLKGQSVVFGSKMCHFIFPKAFFVMDRIATDIMPYEYCWDRMVREWARFSEEEQAIEIVAREILENSQMPMHPNYPYETRIMELCRIGDKWGCP